MSAPREIRELIARFERQLDAYRSPQYNETQLRREFLDPFFKALGWDIDNEQGYAEAYKDVIHEDSIKVGEATKAPDYCFRIGGARKFFLEAKKPAVDIKNDVTPAFQLRRYGFTTKLPLNILSDFEEFAVYDCRFKPDQHDNAARGRILYVPYTEYATRWDEIANIFSRDAVLKGAFDKFAESTKSKRGTADVDDEFLKTIETWRADLARNLALRNPKLTQRELNFAVQRTIDRVIFLRICEGRGIEDYGRLGALVNGERIYPRLAQLFEQADNRYNSGLFHFKKEKDRHEAPDELTLNLDLDDKLLRDILKSLYYPECPYVFSALPADILGQVYEQFLGKVIRLTAGHHAVVEEKPEVKKTGGVYYTPTYIVDYIVQNTFGKLLEGKTPKQAARLRILDPACGSGSFLLGAYEHLLKWHLDFYAKNDPARWAKASRPVLVQTSRGWRLTIAERKRILLDNIYGVDIDEQAVETTKLSLLLKVLEGETQQSLQPVLRMFQERALPDLGDNIKCGNSLIGPDFYQQQQMTLLDDEERDRINVFDWHAEFPSIFRRNSSTGELRETAAASPLDYTMPGVPLHGSYSAKKKKGETAALPSAQIESEWDGGFDAVIGNPPYVRIQTSGKSDLAYFSRHYETAIGNFDIYCLFAERGISLLRRKGLLGFIVAHRFYKTDYGEGLRQFISKRRLLKRTVDFDGFMVFENVSINTCLLLLENRPNTQFFFAKARFTKMRPSDVAQRLSALDQVRHSGDGFEFGNLLATKFTSAPWVFVWPEEETIWAKLKAIPKTLGDVTTHIFQGLKTGSDTYYIGELVSERRESAFVKYEHEDAPVELERKLLKPLIKGGEMQRYSIGDSSKKILFPYLDGALLNHTVLANEYPKTWAYLSRHKNFLFNREDGKMRGSEWYGYTRNQALTAMFLPKIITPDYYAHASYCLDSDGNFFFCGGGAGGYGIVGNDNINLKFLLGLLNSKLLDWFLHKISLRAYQTAYMYVKKYIEQLPVCAIDSSDRSDKSRHDQMVKLVEQMLELHQRLSAAKTPPEQTSLERQISATDTQIDRLVYDLYGLTNEEIKIVESGA